MPIQVTCPICNQDDRVAKVSAIYIKGIESKQAAKKNVELTGNGAATKQAAFIEEFSPDELETLSKKLTPPASRKEAFSRPIHPDQVVLALSLIAPFFIYKVWTSQPASLPVILAVLAGFYGFYLWQRKAILARFEKQQHTQNSSDERVRRAVKRWMGLYYCARDESVFDPGSGDSAPLDQMVGLVYKA